MNQEGSSFYWQSSFIKRLLLALILKNSLSVYPEEITILYLRFAYS